MELAEDLIPADFTEQRQDIWAEMLALHQLRALDQRALIESLRQRGILDTIVQEEYLTELLTHRGDAMEEYSRRVLSASNKRQLVQISGMIIADAQDNNIEDDEAFDNAERRLLRLRRNRTQDMGVPLGAIIGSFQTRQEKFLSGEWTPPWIPEVDVLKWVIQFIDEDDFFVLGGRPGEGKSSLMRYMFIQSALNGTPTLIINLENGELEYAKFALSMVAQVDSMKLKDPSLLSGEEKERLVQASRDLANAPLYVKTIGSPSAIETDRIIRHHINHYNVERVGVDYIQLMENPGSRNEVSNVTTSSKSLRAAALNYKVPVMANSQLSREIEHRGENAHPKLADLRESGSLEQDATIVCIPRFTWGTPTDAQLRMFTDNINDDGELFESPKAVPLTLHVLKNRNGSIGTSRPVLWRKHMNDFNNIEEV
jgi:replicative DNA helicase